MLRARLSRHAHATAACPANGGSSLIRLSERQGMLTELRDGSIMFSFGEAADDSSVSAAAAHAATAAGVSSEAAEAAAAAGSEATGMTDSSAAAAQSEAAPAADETTAQQAEDVADAAYQLSSSDEDDDPHTATADAGSNSHSVDKIQLKDMKVAELKEIARENDLKGYSTLRKNELVDFLTDALPGDYQI